MVSVLTKSPEETLKPNAELEKEQDIEWRACRKSPKYFLTKYAYVINRNTGKKVKWLPWEYQLKLLDIFMSERDILILKARQLGISWLVSGFGLWKTMFLENAKALVMSKGETEAWNMIDRARYILENLPPFLQLSQKHPDNKGVIDYNIRS